MWVNVYREWQRLQCQRPCGDKGVKVEGKYPYRWLVLGGKGYIGETDVGAR